VSKNEIIDPPVVTPEIRKEIATAPRAGPYGAVLVDRI
jgi:hypothetical protein